MEHESPWTVICHYFLETFHRTPSKGKVCSFTVAWCSHSRWRLKVSHIVVVRLKYSDRILNTIVYIREVWGFIYFCQQNTIIWVLLPQLENSIFQYTVWGQVAKSIGTGSHFKNARPWNTYAFCVISKSDLFHMTSFLVLKSKYLMLVFLVSLQFVSCNGVNNCTGLYYITL